MIAPQQPKVSPISISRALAIVTLVVVAFSSISRGDELEDIFRQPPAAARPWVFWYWLQGAVSREGITADLQAMRDAGLGGAYLMPIQGPGDPPLVDPPIVQLTPEFWAMVRHAAEEADRLDLELAMHVCDGFATAGGPWITPEQSMQKVVWSETQLEGGKRVEVALPQPETIEGYYRDIRVVTFPARVGTGVSTRTVPVAVTASDGAGVGFLAKPASEGRYRYEGKCWVQYEFKNPFTCRSVRIEPDGTNYQALRPRLEVSNDGKSFREVTQLEPPRHGWQDSDGGFTFAIAPITARYFRFYFDPAGSEPGSEDLDRAKWKPVLKINRLELIASAQLHQYEGKSGVVWRIAPETNIAQAPDELCVDPNDIVDLSERMSPEGKLIWEAPKGEWTVMRFGHTSTGHHNDTGGGGRGLECDKFRPDVVRLQYDKWFGEARRQLGPELAERVLKVFHVDSWECGSQNWSPVFRGEFQRRRGYDVVDYLPVLAGVPVESAERSEEVLHDVRTTIAELVVDSFYGTLEALAHEAGCRFSAESVAPTFTNDGMLHFRAVDVPMGEFWLRSPTHDKPNDMLDAIHGAHVYGKPIVQAEAYTELRMAWDEHPGMFKSLGDLQYARGINRMVYHVFMHNPWLDRRPGITLGRIGLYAQRDQTWWKPGRAWVEYATRCQAMLQWGKPVVDIAVFTGEEIPRRAVLPERLISILPGLIGAEQVALERQRLANEGQPLRDLPEGVSHSANMTDQLDWLDPLRGYQYDSINRDALLRLAIVREGRIELPGGASYAVLVIPDKQGLSPQVARKLEELREAGASVIDTPYFADDLTPHGVPRDMEVRSGAQAIGADIAWAHRATDVADIYFLSNPHDEVKNLVLSLRGTGRQPEFWDPVTGEMISKVMWHPHQGRTTLPLQLPPHGSMFVVLRTASATPVPGGHPHWQPLPPLLQLDGAWEVRFSPAAKGPSEPVQFADLADWTQHSESGIRHYSGTAQYRKIFRLVQPRMPARIWLDLGRVENLAEVTVNGKNCGVVWTPPYRVEITSAVNNGENELTIAVTNTWANRLIGDAGLPNSERITRTASDQTMKGKPLLPAGLLGPVKLVGTD